MRFHVATAVKVEGDSTLPWPRGWNAIPHCDGREGGTRFRIAMAERVERDS